MPIKKIPINSALYQNVDGSELTTMSEQRRDVFLDETGTTVRRPGLNAFGEIGTTYAVDGMYYWETKDLVYFVANGSLYTINEVGMVALLQSSILNKGSRPTFDESINPTRKLFIANGGKIVQTDGVTAAVLTDSNAPTTVSHIAIFDTYLLANEEGTQKMHFSGVGTPEVWAGEFATAESQTDDIIAIGSAWDEIGLFGSRSIENFYDNGVIPFAPIPGADIAVGISAKHSVKLIDNSWFFLNEERRLTRVLGRQPKVLSLPVDRILSGMSVVSDALIDQLTVGGRTFIVLSFPAEGRTLVYDYAKQEWVGEWGYWDTKNAIYERWRGNCILYVPQWNKYLVGDRENGKIYTMSLDTYQDDGDLIRSMWMTGNIDHGTLTRKRSFELRIKLRRGSGFSDDPILMVRWRDDGSKQWGNTRNISLGKQGDTEFIAKILRLGSYRTRQYEISCTDNVPIGVIYVEERVEVSE